MSQNDLFGGYYIQKQKKIGPCGIGKKAVYLSSFYFDRRYYIPIGSVKRIFKRIAMSKGGFTGKGAFGALSKEEYDEIVTIKPMFLVMEYQ